jgi:hypothetical protein
VAAQLSAAIAGTRTHKNIGAYLPTYVGRCTYLPTLTSAHVRVLMYGLLSGAGGRKLSPSDAGQANTSGRSPAGVAPPPYILSLQVGGSEMQYVHLRAFVCRR